MRTAALAAVSLLALTACGQADTSADASGSTAADGGQVWAAGSSTVFPFATRVAETVSRTSGGPAPKVESLGTGGGFKMFCSSAGTDAPDIANASRAMKKSEWDACQAAGVTDIVEIKIGYDGIVVANDKAGATYNLTREQLFKALNAESTAKTWKDVDASLPGERIQVYGPPPTSGTRDAFVELALEAGAKKDATLKALAKSDEKAFKARAHPVRTDGAWIDSGENDNAIVQTLAKTPGAVGVFGYSFLDNNMDTVKPASIEGVAPSIATISDGSYPLSRSLFIYVKKASMTEKPAVKAFVDAFVSDAASGKGGYLQSRGLIPLPDADRTAQKAAAGEMKAMTAPTS
ncbi:MAG TPA: substrate-binding domain-containing protein [Caulobacteraceae bacterium]|nr:substrate-binding domain-containing protein [Caulobacteraceae bacterium]